MDRTRHPAPQRARLRCCGFVTVQFVAVVALSLLLFAQLANLLVWSYGRGVVRAALDEGARAGARAGVVECERRARELLEDLLPGALGDQVAPVRCREEAGLVAAAGGARFAAWLPSVPDWTFSAEAVAVAEPVLP